MDFVFPHFSSIGYINLWLFAQWKFQMRPTAATILQLSVCRIDLWWASFACPVRRISKTVYKMVKYAQDPILVAVCSTVFLKIFLCLGFNILVSISLPIICGFWLQSPVSTFRRTVSHRQLFFSKLMSDRLLDLRPFLGGAHVTPDVFGLTQETEGFNWCSLVSENQGHVIKSELCMFYSRTTCSVVFLEFFLLFQPVWKFRKSTVWSS